MRTKDKIADIATAVLFFSVLLFCMLWEKQAL